MRKLSYVLVGLTVLVIAICTVGAISSWGDKEDEGIAITVPLESLASESPGFKVGKAAGKSVKPVTIGEGMWLVGKDVKAGTYRTSGTLDAMIPFCVWSVRAGDDPSAEVLDFGTSDKENESGRVKLKKGDVFETSGCKDWVLAN